MTVYCVHPISGKDKNRVDLSPAEVFGDLRYINTRYIFADELGEDGSLPRLHLNAMLRVVDDWDPDQDYLLIAGDHLQIVAMSAYLSGRWGFFRVLRFDREAKGYVPTLIGTPDGFETDK